MPGKYKTYSPEFRDEAARLVVETSRAIADVAGRGAEGVVMRMPEPVQALSCGSPWGVVFRFVAVCPDGGLVHRRSGRGAVGRLSGRLCSDSCRVVMIARNGGSGGHLACARRAAVR